MVQIIWKEQTGRFQNGENAFVGTVCVGCIEWCSAYGGYKVRLTLPVINDKVEKRSEREESKDILEIRVRYWFRQCGFKEVT